MCALGVSKSRSKVFAKLVARRALLFSLDVLSFFFTMDDFGDVKDLEMDD